MFIDNNYLYNYSFCSAPSSNVNNHEFKRKIIRKKLMGLL